MNTPHRRHLCASWWRRRSATTHGLRYQFMPGRLRQRPLAGRTAMTVIHLPKPTQARIPPLPSAEFWSDQNSCVRGAAPHSVAAVPANTQCPSSALRPAETLVQSPSQSQILAETSSRPAQASACHRQGTCCTSGPHAPRMLADVQPVSNNKWPQLLLVLFVLLLVEPIFSQCIYPFINQVLSLLNRPTAYIS